MQPAKSVDRRSDNLPHVAAFGDASDVTMTPYETIDPDMPAHSSDETHNLVAQCNKKLQSKRDKNGRVQCEKGQWS
ncbi:hypothetical protein [Bradyrhizobium sp.]|uniref:hypothetical protein n=1 Tax=Bradyrhizobium sp. TaxID=376 RepID=UPI002DDD5B49|nr:hypothetical protein [Bradyrhizobium sp.]HEV2158110.1 hypothetical protein [Bradyrhizobium sp.]